MPTVPNQKTIKVNKERCDSQNKYTPINLNALQYAMIDLKGESLKLWLYIGKNQANYTFGLSKVDAIRWGIGSKSSYDRAVRELIDKGYLVETSSNHYDFYEIPPLAKEEIVVTVRKEDCGFQM